MLRHDRPLAALLPALPGIERLVLLGDTIEFRQGPAPTALQAAAPILGALAAKLDAGAEVVVVPGNHDHVLASPWLERRAHSHDADRLELESAVEHQVGEPLAAVVEALAPARVRVAYPGVWLREDVYATHGHYSDRHITVPMFESLGAAVTARVINEPAGGPRTIEQYEAALSPVYAWIYAAAQHTTRGNGDGVVGASERAWRTLVGSGGRRRLRTLGLGLGFNGLIAALNRAGLGPLSADLSGGELRRAGLRAFAEMTTRLEIGADHVIFGHTHRAGPLPADHRLEWHPPGTPQLLNTGCWVHEPNFLGSRPSTSPYRAGFVVLIDGEQPPQLINLLDSPPPPARA